MRCLAWAIVAGLLAAAPAAGSSFVDAITGAVDGSVVTASEIAIARALALFGFAPSAAAIDAADVQRMLAARLIVAEARQLDIGGAAAEVERGWQAAAARVGGAPALQRWLASVDLETDFVRGLVADDLRWRRFIDVRFRDFAFVMPDEVAAALGPGEHDAAVEERTRERLRAEQARRELAAWVRERALSARVQNLLEPDARVPVPFGPPR